MSWSQGPPGFPSSMSVFSHREFSHWVSHVSSPVGRWSSMTAEQPFLPGSSLSSNGTAWCHVPGFRAPAPDFSIRAPVPSIFSTYSTPSRAQAQVGWPFLFSSPPIPILLCYYKASKNTTNHGLWGVDITSSDTSAGICILKRPDTEGT
jgi:hypothetical protein